MAEKNQSGQRKMLDGNSAAAEGFRLSNVDFIAAYPITPQSPLAEKLADYCSKGIIDAHYMRVESEHTAISAVLGASMGGARAATATASVGLALMHEILGVVSGCRVPAVMVVCNRSLASPWNLWCDHEDSMSVRECGWLQLYAGTPQEVLDLVLMAYKISEHSDVHLPVMVCQDGFYVTHAVSSVMVPNQEEVNQFLPAYEPQFIYMDPQRPMTINQLITNEHFPEFRYQQRQTYQQASLVIEEVGQEFGEIFGRTYKPIETYYTEDADIVFVTLGSMSGAALYTVEQERKKGNNVGLLQIRSYRPFPAKQIEEALQNVKAVGVLERMSNKGASFGPLTSDISAVTRSLSGLSTFGFIAGLGGRDVTPGVFVEMLEKINNYLQNGEQQYEMDWVDINWNMFQAESSEEVVDHGN